MIEVDVIPVSQGIGSLILAQTSSVVTAYVIRVLREKMFTTYAGWKPSPGGLEETWILQSATAFRSRTEADPVGRGFASAIGGTFIERQDPAGTDKKQRERGDWR